MQMNNIPKGMRFIPPVNELQKEVKRTIHPYGYALYIGFDCLTGGFFEDGMKCEQCAIQNCSASNTYTIESTEDYLLHLERLIDLRKQGKMYI